MANQNILTISDSDNEKIQYHKSEMKTSYEHYLDFDELIKIYNDCPENIFRYNTINAISLIKTDNTEISLHQYKSDDNIAFIKLSDKNLTEYNSEILLSVKYLRNYSGPRECIWESLPSAAWCYENIALKNELNEIMLQNIDGYTACEDFFKHRCRYYGCIYTDEAAEMCQKEKESYNESVYRGFLPSLYQLTMIIDYIELIDSILQYIGYRKNMIACMKKCMNEANSLKNMKFWSSTIIKKGPNAYDRIYAYSIGRNYYEIFKDGKCFIFPIFKKLPANKH